MLGAIVNSTSLIALRNIGRLDLLQNVKSRIVIPQAVFDEVTEKDDSACRQIKQCTDWIEYVDDTVKTMVLKQAGKNSQGI